MDYLFIINEIDKYVYSDKYVIEQINDEYKQLKIRENDPHYFHHKNLIIKYQSYVTKYHFLKNENNENNDDVCCICIDKHDFSENMYFKCTHYVCKSCFDIAKMNFGSSLCPICRCIIERIIFNEKYAIVALGAKTEFNKFENGGYESVCIVYIPEYKNMKNSVIKNIKYHDDNKPREEFEMLLLTLMTDEYTIIFQDFNKMKLWLSDILLKDFVYDNNIIHE